VVKGNKLLELEGLAIVRVLKESEYANVFSTSGVGNLEDGGLDAFVMGHHF